MTLVHVGHFANQLFDYCLSQQEKYLCRVVQWLRAVGLGGGEGGGGEGGGEEGGKWDDINSPHTRACCWCSVDNTN